MIHNIETLGIAVAQEQIMDDISIHGNDTFSRYVPPGTEILSVSYNHEAQTYEILLKPTRAVEHIELNCIVTKNGVEFKNINTKEHFDEDLFVI